MKFNTSTTLALAGLGAAIGAIVNNSPKSRGEFFSSERMVGSLLGFGLGYAVGEVGYRGQVGLGSLELSELPNTPLKRQPITIVRTDAATAYFNPDAQPLPNPAARLVLGDRLLIG